MTSRPRSRAVAFPFVIAALSLAAPPRLTADDSGDRPSNDCGILTLSLMLQLRDRPATLEELERALPAADGGGASMAELRDAARSLGVTLEGVRVTAADFPLDRPAIAFLDRDGSGHFVLLRPVGTTGTMVQILDPPRLPAVTDYDRLVSNPSWTGRLLVPGSGGGWVRGLSLSLRIVPALLLIRGRLPIAGRRRASASSSAGAHNPSSRNGDRRAGDPKDPGAAIDGSSVGFARSRPSARISPRAGGRSG